MSSSSETVNVNVKTANGSVEDLKISGLEEWCVFDLKVHLCGHHPLHPPVRGQKLIHKGHLLQDETVLHNLVQKDEILILHLAISPAYLQSPVTKPDKTIHERPHLPPSLTPVSSSPPTNNNVSNSSQTNAINQQQQMFSNWLRYRTPTMRPDEQPPPPMSFPAPPMMWPNPYLMSPYYAAQMAQWYNATMQGGNINTSPVNQANTPAETDGLLLENQAREGGDGQDLELPDDMGINGGGGFALMAENRRRRDAVDYAYMLMMLMFLGSIGYMAGSFYQFIIFFAGVAVILLNQGGWFTVQRRQVNLPQEEQHRDEERRDDEDNTDGNEVREENQEREDDEIHPAQENQDANNDRPGHRQGIITTIIVFVTSFFSSLLPQQVPEIEAN